MTKFARYRVDWTNMAGEPQEASFYLPEQADVDAYVGALLNLVSLDSSEAGFKYNLVFVEVVE